MAELIDGKAIGRTIQEEVRAGVESLRSTHGITPGLAVLLVGDDPASKTYVAAKARTCTALGMHSINEQLPVETGERELLDRIRELNSDPLVHAILVQLPLPQHLSADRVVDALSPLKDVDGLHPENAGLLALGRPRFIPCTPLGVCELLSRSSVDVRGKELVVIGRSNLVGRPLSILLSSKRAVGDATVTICHSASSNLREVARRADILVVAIGRREFVGADMVKPGAVVIDVGTHPANDGTKRLWGDVHFEAVAPIASKITPVPGGVGPMTIAMLMRNTLESARRFARLEGRAHVPARV